MKINHSIKNIILILMFFSITACTPVPEEPMNLATINWTGYGPLHLAQKLGFYEESDLHLIELTSASDMLRNFRNGVIDAATLTLDEALLLKQDGFDIQVVLVMDISHGADAIIAREGISNMQALKGKRVGVEKTALGAYMLSRALGVSGMSVRDLNIIPIVHGEAKSSFKQGRVDAVVTFEPIRSYLLNAGGNIIFDSSQIPGEIIDVLVVRSQYLERYPDKVTQVLAGWFRALEAMNIKRDESARFLAGRSHLRVVEYNRALKGLRFPDFAENQKLLKHGENSIVQHIIKLKKIMLEKHLLNNEIDTLTMVSNQPLLKVKP